MKLERQRSGESDEISDEEEAEYKAIAERRVRLGLILAEVGNQNKTTISEQELQMAVIREAQRYPGQEREVFDYYSKNRNALESLRAPLFEDKVVDYILELAQVSEKEVSGDELIKILEDDSEDAPKPAKKKTASQKSSDKKEDGEKAEKKAEDKKPAAKKKAPAKK